VSGRTKLLKQGEKFELRLNREAGIPVKICAQMAGCSLSTAMRALAELRVLMGPEKLPARKRHLARVNSDTSQRATRSAD
jgi:hypothetical protein